MEILNIFYKNVKQNSENTKMCANNMHEDVWRGCKVDPIH